MPGISWVIVILLGAAATAVSSYSAVTDPSNRGAYIVLIVLGVLITAVGLYALVVQRPNNNSPNAG